MVYYGRLGIKVDSFLKHNHFNRLQMVQLECPRVRNHLELFTFWVNCRWSLFFFRTPKYEEKGNAAGSKYER